MAKSKISVTVCIPTHNRVHFIADTIQSALSQTYKNFELLICDDASTDRTQEVIKSFKDTRIRLLTNTKNLGYIATMNKCTKLAKGDWIMHLSDDDLMSPRLLEEQVKIIKKYIKIPIAYIVPQSTNINSQGEIISIPPKQLGRRVDILLHPKEAIPNFTLYGKKIKGVYQFSTSFPSALFNKKIFLKEGMSSDEVPVAHDVLIMAKLCLKYPVVFLDDALFSYRVHENWGSSLNSTGKFLEEYKRFLELLFMYVKDNNIRFSYDFKKYCYDSLIKYLFALNGGLVRLGARFKGSPKEKRQIVSDYVKFGLQQRRGLLLLPEFYISLFLSFFPSRVLIWGGKLTKKI